MSLLCIMGLINSIRSYFDTETLRLEVFTSSIDTRYQIPLMIDELNNIIAGRGVPISDDLRTYISSFPRDDVIFAIIQEMIPQEQA